MGSETYLYLYINDNSIIAKVDPSSKAKSGDKIKVYVDLSKIHLFDKENELNILKP